MNNVNVFRSGGNTLINTGLDPAKTPEAQQLVQIYATERVGFAEKLRSVFGLNSEMLLEFISLGGNSGSQSSRLQIDATADGSLHVIGATDGVGEYNMTFLDGPFIIPTDRTAAGIDSFVEDKWEKSNLTTWSGVGNLGLAALGAVGKGLYNAGKSLVSTAKKVGNKINNTAGYTSVLAFYNQRKDNILGREVTIYIFNRNQGEKGITGSLETMTNNRWTSYSGIAFNGIVQKVEISLKQLDAGSYGVQVGFNIIGGWRD